MSLNFWGNKQKRILEKFKKDGIIFKGNVMLDDNVTFNLKAPFFTPKQGSIVIENNAKFSQGFICHAYGGKVSIGQNVFFGPYCVLYGHGNITIGDNAMIAMGCKIAANSHVIPSPGIMINTQPDIPEPINIGKDVLMYADVVVLPGVTIGDGCIIGAGSVVTKSIPPNSYAVGVPAKVIKERK